MNTLFKTSIFHKILPLPDNSINKSNANVHKKLTMYISLAKISWHVENIHIAAIIQDKSNITITPINI
jgi:hypothetical protein